MTDKTKILFLYLLSFFLSGISAFLYYKYIYGMDFLINFIFVAIVIVPIIFLILSILFDKLVVKEDFNLGKLSLSFLYLPLLISIHFIIITYGYMSGFSEAVFLWYFLLFLPLIVNVLYFHFVHKYAFKSKKTFIIIKYVLSIILYLYCFFIWFAYNLSGMGV